MRERIRLSTHTCYIYISMSTAVIKSYVGGILGDEEEANKEEGTLFNHLRS